ncbi:MAG TPA: hypothetical protein VEK57_12880 [Thermoanaerobaculia bacterium]|nr:hypothetical protein [Thermoanaerobaculia bacterium]
MADPLILYSTNTWLAYVIGERFYGSQHYVWCTPDFDARALPRIEQIAPPSSSPAEIYQDLYEDVRRGDKHSSKIKDNKAGLLRGAAAKRAASMISEDDYRVVVSTVKQAQGRDFRPLLYVIPFARVRAIVQPAPVELRAHPLSREYIIEHLPRVDFDALELPLGGM